MIWTSILILLSSLALIPFAWAQTELSATHVAELRAEQAAPRHAVPFDPKDFDKFIGAYELFPTAIEWITRDGSHYMIRLTGQSVGEIFPESQTKFFSNETRAQFSFENDAGGHVTALVVHQNGAEPRAPRISVRAGKALEAALVARIKAGKPAPGTEASLRRYIVSLENGKPNYQEMAPNLSAVVHEELPMILPQIAQFGPLKSITFRSVNPAGMDVYDVEFANSKVTWMIAPLTADGKVYMRGFQVRP
jgi:hypothetical protein